MDPQLLEQLLETSRQLAETRELDPLLAYAMQVALKLFSAEKGYLVLLGENGELEFRVKQDWRGNQLEEPQSQISRTILNRAVAQRQPIITSDALHEPGYADAESVQLLRLRSVVCVPLIARGRPIGAIYLENRREKGVFERTDLKPLGYFAAQVAISVENAALNDDLEQRVAHRTQELQARNQELDAFARTVAHDLRNPLGLVVGYAEILREEFSSMPAAEVREFLGQISQHGRKMSDILEALLTLAGVRQAAVEIAPVDMKPIVDSAIWRLSNIIQAQAAEITVPDSWPTALGYGPWLEEVWVNYLSNAIKYGGQPPRIELGAKLVPGRNPTARFWVRDNGDGVQPEQQNILFEPFTRLDRGKASGHGLGLSIVQRIVERLGGSISVESEGLPGRGSTFYFILPAVPSVGPSDETVYHKRD